MGPAIRAELIKIRRSWTLVVACAVPLVAVATGTFNYAANTGDGISPGWASLWSQIVIFYSLFFMSMGIAVLAAALWRTEHRGANWNALMTTGVPPWRIIAAKTVVLVMLIALMQVVLVAATWIAATSIAGLGASMPPLILAVSALAVAAGAAVAAWQLMLSMLIRSFAIPIALALALAATIIGVLVPLAGYTRLAYALPYSLIGRTLATGSVAASDAAALSPGQVAAVLAAATTLTLLATALATWTLTKRDVRT